MPTILLFLKFGKQEHIEDLYYNGTIYMNSIEFFRKFEDGQLRGDKYEGVEKIENWPPGQFEIPEIGYKGKYINIHIMKPIPGVGGNIFSLYCISSHGWQQPEDVKIHERNLEFGTHCLVIKKCGEFMRRVEAKLSELVVQYHHSLVDYYDSRTVNRQISVFEKPREFEFQKEFRFYVDREAVDPFVFSIGSIEDISEIRTSEEMVKTLVLTSRSTTSDTKD